MCHCRRPSSKGRWSGPAADDDDDVDGCEVQEICRKCHISSSLYWGRADKYVLPVSVRQENDPMFAAFLDTMRHGTPTQAQIDAAFGTPDRPQCAGFINPADIATHADEHTTVLCTRVSDALAVNRDVLQRLSQDGKVGPVYPATITHDVHDLHAFRALEEAWLRKPKFRKLEYVAVGAKVLLTENIHVASGFANGAAAVVEELRLGTDEHGQARVDGIRVRLESNGKVRTLTRSTKRTIYENGVRYTKATFPLALAYAITAHRSQVSMCKFLAHAHAPRQHAVGPGCMQGVLSCCLPGKKDEQHVACGVGTTGTDHARSTLCRLVASQPLTCLLPHCRCLQGATLSGRTILLARNVFTPGQLYVMLSRVTERRLITLAGRLTPAMCRPVVACDFPQAPVAAAAPAAAPAAAAAAAGPSGTLSAADQAALGLRAGPRKRTRITFEYDADRPDFMPDV